MNLISRRPHTKEEKRKWLSEIRRFKSEKRDTIRALKSQPCRDCGNVFHPDAMDFDHVPGRGWKLGSVPSRGSIGSVISEAKKCDVVCSNCHRIRTKKRRQDRKHQLESQAERLNAIEEMVERAREATRGIMEEAPISFNNWYES